MSHIQITTEVRDRLKAIGVESFHGQHVNLPTDVTLEAPCSIKWMSMEHSLKMGAFSYAVTGFYSCLEMGRYCSIGEDVQIGRQDHHTNWLSTSPFQYLNSPLFDVGDDFAGGDEFAKYRSHTLGTTKGMEARKTVIGHDVWIGHGAFVKAGVKIGTGAIVAAHSVVVKDVPPFSVVAGNPAVIKKFRISELHISKMLETRWWEYAPWQLNSVPFSDVENAVDVLAEMRQSDTPTFSPSIVHLGDLKESS